MRRPRACALHVSRSPRKAKRLYFDVIPRAVDEYLGAPRRLSQGGAGRRSSMNPVWHIHPGEPPQAELPISFALLLNLASRVERRGQGGAVGLHPHATRRMPRPEQHPLLDQLVGYAMRYFHDFVKPAKTYRPPTSKSARRCSDLDDAAWPRLAPGAQCRGDPERGLCRRQGARASSRCAPGSRRSTRCCSARPRARASAPSSSSTASPRRAR